jgi:hypothetical protein
MRRTRITTLLAATTMFVGGAFAIGSPASASLAPPGGGAWDYRWVGTGNETGAEVDVLKHGDVIDLCDTKADGKAPRAEVLYDLGGGNIHYYPITDGDGYGTCVGHEASDGGAYDLPEGYTIEVTFGVGPDWATTGNNVTHSFKNDA